MGSSRLPGKVLADFDGRPLLEFMLARLAGLRVDHLVVATTESAGDDDVVALCRRLGVDVVRGPERDVLTRFRMVIDAYPADVVVRLTADCPLVDPTIVHDAVELQSRTTYDYASNTLVRTFPDGLDVEVLTAESLRVAAAAATDDTEREHVTPFVYRRPEQFGLVTLRTDVLAGDERWTVDTPDDLSRVRSLAAGLGDRFSWLDVLAKAGRQRPPGLGTLHLRPAVAADRELLLAWRNDPKAVEFSRSGAPVDAEEHGRWLSWVLRHPATRLWVGEIDGLACGQVRVDVRRGVGVVSVSVAPEHRGRGLGAALLVALQGALGADHQVVRLVAEVHEGNVASRRAFARAGFLEQSASRPFLCLVWDRPVTAVPAAP